MVETQLSKKLKTIDNAKLDSPSPSPRVDGLSPLPDTVLADILSCIPTKSAICTSILSTRWRYLWTQLTNINLDCRNFPRHAADFYPVVDELLTRLNSPLLRSLTLHAPYARKQTFDLWLRHLSTRNVQYIDISVEGHCYGIYSGSASLTIPLSILQSKSLQRLTLPTNCLKYALPNNTDLILKLPNLTALEISLPPLQCGLLAKLLRYCPLLEDLCLTTVKHVHNGRADDAALIDISCEKLKKLRLHFYFSGQNTELLIDAPRLDWLYLYAFRFGGCSFANKPNVLRDASIKFQSHNVVLSLLPLITNVTSLHLYAESFVAMFTSFKGNSSNFPNLVELTLDISYNFNLPNIFVPESNSTSLLLSIKRITVTIYNLIHTAKLKVLVEFLLSNAPNLKSLTFYLYPRSDEREGEVRHKAEEMLFCVDLYSWRASNSSSVCKIDFRGQHAKLPTNDAELQEMKERVPRLRRYLHLQKVVRAL